MNEDRVRNKDREIDPGILEILGGLSTLIGLAENVVPGGLAEKIVVIGRLNVASRHKKIDTLLGKFKVNIDDARMALRSLNSVMESVDESIIPTGTINFYLSSAEFQIYRRSLNQLQSAISKLTNTAHDLEATLAGIATEGERFYKISQVGRPVLKNIANALEVCALESNSNHNVTLSTIIKDVDNQRC